MEARFARAVFFLALPALAIAWQLAAQLPLAHAAGYRTANFVVTAPTPQLAKEIGDEAEVLRKKLAIEWLGQEMPSWSRPCPINARVAHGMGAGGATSFIFDRGEVFDWKMDIQGSRERVLDSVLPHEITHTVFASHFRQPLPRWADEGACTTVEHRSEIAKQERILIQVLKTHRGIPFDEMFAMKDYPSDVMRLYSQGHSVAQWLIESRGRAAFLNFLADGLRDENWTRAVHQHYGFANLPDMQNNWLGWVKAGRPPLVPATLVASNGQAPGEAPIYRGQSPDDITPIPGPEPGLVPVDQASLPAQPVAAAAPPAPGQLATNQVAARQSVYALAAERARALRAGDSAPAGLYDASRQSGTTIR
jgi:hypothetical protein